MNIQNNFIPSLAAPKTKVLIGVPCRDMMYSHFAFCLQELVEHHTRRGIETHVEFNMGTLIGSQREQIAEKALSINATHIFWLDSDMLFPKRVCETLLSHNLDFVACNYSRRSLPKHSVAYSKMNDWESSINQNERGLISVAGVGLGCALLKTYVLSDIQKPWFPITYDFDTKGYLGEDFNFCQKLIERGYVIAVDCEVSREVYHVGSTAFEWKMTEAVDKPATV